MMTLIKEKQSKLDPFEETLLEMDAAKKTLVQMQQWLSDHGVAISIPGISLFLTSRRRRRWQRQMLDKIASGAQQVEEAKTGLQTHGAPDLNILIKLSQLLIFQHTSKVVIDPEFSSQTRQLTKMVLSYIKNQANLEVKKSDAKLAATKLAIREESARLKALKYCLQKAGKHSAATELFRTAFAALPPEQPKQPDRLNESV
jgi:hypothetical protein